MAAVIWRRRKPVRERYNAIGEFNDRKTGTIKEAAKKKHRKNACKKCGGKRGGGRGLQNVH